MYSLVPVPDPSHEVLEIIDCCNVVVVHFNVHIWVDPPGRVGEVEGVEVEGGEVEGGEVEGGEEEEGEMEGGEVEGGQVEGGEVKEVESGKEG